MRIKTMTPAMIAALFPPKPKPEEAWRRDYPAEPADLPPPAPPEPEAQAPRVSLVDILRQKHAEDQRAAAALNPIRLGTTQLPGGLFGIPAGPAPLNMAASPVRPSGLSMPPTGFDLQQPPRANPVRAALPPIEHSLFAQPSFGNFRQDERRRYPDDFPPFGFPPFGFPSSRRDQDPWVMHAEAPASSGVESDRDRDRAGGPAPAQPSSSGPAPALPDRPPQVGAPLRSTSFQIGGLNQSLTDGSVGTRPNKSNNMDSRQPQIGRGATNSVTPALPKFGAGPTFGFASIPAWLMTYPNYNDLQLVADRQSRALWAPHGAIYIAPPRVTNDYLLAALNHLSDVKKNGGPFAVEKEFRSM